ncbi:sulfate adenylyltransferase [Sporosarcina pasteurii]|uniref:Probable bifunctional SAT/APS kinase n=1 Tax=Sporosarcina pasteurii TaxID=1474 RepID=A0A380CBS0_SPOPA|nr:sulfate adenylyltransferase [Sporosarcina pasteurii]MDS9473108.1 sulfate adenylyltransferase [Sporosarcina pasteurii]QBQ04243.1 sulfate adenylyltransferase [Sporosarcina pasteurii]SUJ17164.1 Probable bifunctional SAT/APS kinase [Sporosarcina pasteurii]
MTQQTTIQEKMNFKNYPQQPHGGKLVDKIVKGKELEAELLRAEQLPKIMIDMEAVITVEMIATGVLSPNEGFMNEVDYKSVLMKGRLDNGLVWPVPLSFAPIGKRNEKIVKTLSVGDEVSLVDEQGQAIAILKLDDIFDYDKEFRASHLFGTTDRNHPGVDAIYRRMGDTALGGPIKLLRRVDWGPFEKLRLEPKDTWREFYEEKKFRSAAGFITGANPLHRGHEYIHKNALEEIDGLLLQPLVEMAKREYTRHEFRMLSYRSVLETYYPQGRSILAPLRVTYIFAGPRETVLHALIMKNYGCTHALIGRDHAGIGEYYDKYASHTIFDEFDPAELGIDVRLFHEVFYCTRCDASATEQSCPHDNQYRINISGTGIREMLRHGIMPPKEIVRPESARIAMQGVQPKGLDEEGNSVSPVGKTIKSMFPFYLERTSLGGRKRPVPLTVEELTNIDLETVNLDVRANADRIYQEIFEEFSRVGDVNRGLQPEWISSARESLHKQQQMVIQDLEEKVAQAPEIASDEFMYQDKEEAKRELEVAKKILEDIPAALDDHHLAYRTWNVLPYKRYCGSDEPTDEDRK